MILLLLTLLISTQKQPAWQIVATPDVKIWTETCSQFFKMTGLKEQREKSVRGIMKMCRQGLELTNPRFVSLPVRSSPQ